MADVHRVARPAGDDRFAERVRQARAAGLAGDVCLGCGNALEGIVDRTIPGAAAEVAFQRVRQVRPLLLVERGGRHDHARGAKAALEGLRVEEGLLHRMQRAVCAPGPRWW